MPDTVTAKDCEDRRNHCQEAMAATCRRIEATQAAFFDRFEERVTARVGDISDKQATANVEIAKISERSKSNTHRLNWVWGILAGIIIAVIGMLIRMIITKAA